MIGLDRKRKLMEKWRDAVVEDEIRIAALERQVKGLIMRVKELEEKVKKLEEGRS